MRAVIGVGIAAILLAMISPSAALPVATISIETSKGKHVFRVEVAGDRRSQERGLMFRKSLAPNAGMLFDFHQPVMTSFWMKNTLLPLDIIFILNNGRISSVAADAVPLSEASIPSSEPIRAVLEINAGLAKALDIEPGDLVNADIFRNGR